MADNSISNDLGSRGEYIFSVVLTTFHGVKPLFRVHPLGEKCPGIDFMCELVGAPRNHKIFFFVQVKATGRGLTRRDERLRVSIEKDKAIDLSLYGVPVYLVGVDNASERAFIVAAEGKIKALSSMAAGNELNKPETRKALWKEVNAYWGKMRPPRKWSSLLETSWKK